MNEKSENPIKILISGGFGTKNTGDEAILISEVSSIRREISNADITVLVKGTNKENISRLNLKTINDSILNIRQIIRGIMRSDILILGGGGMLQDESSIYNIIGNLYKLLIAIMLRKKIYLYAVGAVPLRSMINRKLLSYVLRKVNFITVRDLNSEASLVGLEPSIKNKIKAVSYTHLTLPTN